jgi:ketosteroid isomerase-like protein
MADEALPEIEAFLEQYRRATEARDVAALGAMYVAFSPEQRAALERYFGGVRDLRVAIDHIEAAVVRDEAVVTYARTDDFVDVQTGRPGHVAVRLTKTLSRVDGRWLFAASR